MNPLEFFFVDMKDMQLPKIIALKQKLDRCCFVPNGIASKFSNGDHSGCCPFSLPLPVIFHRKAIAHLVA